MDSRLGIKIKPVDVRLNPREIDFYSWRVTQGKEELYSRVFAKNLSDHSTGTYRLLCREVGKSFQAVPPCIQVSALDSIRHLLHRTQWITAWCMQNADQRNT